MKAIHFQLNASKTIVIRYGESSFKRIDEYWTDFTPTGGTKQTLFIPNIIPDTEKNRVLVGAIQQGYAEIKKQTDEWEKAMYKLRNQFEK